MSEFEITGRHELGEDDSPMSRRAEAMCKAANAEPLGEFEGALKTILLLHDDETGVVVMEGYDDSQEAFSDLLTYLRAMAAAAGVRVEVVPVSHPGNPRDN